MDPNNPIPSNHDQFDVKPTYIKQLIDDDMDMDMNVDLLLKNTVCERMARNGKHRDDDDDEYDYTDVGPETDVDAGEDVHDDNYPLATSSSLDPSPESEKSPVETEKHRNDNNYSNRDNANVCPVDSVVDDDDVDNRVRPSDRDVRGAVDETLRDNDDDDARVETAGTHTVVDDDEPPRTAKPLQHALIVADNVADSEDSEDEWDYYRVDPNKQESAAAVVATDESCKSVEKQSAQENPESVAKGTSEIESSEIENDIKCEELVKDISSPELINIDISDERKASEPDKDQILLNFQEEKREQDNMDFQLNPEAAEFVPLSPPLLARGFLQDFAISGSPLKQTQVMDDIPIPSQSEFDKEVCYRPKEIGEEFAHEHADLQNNSSQSMDISEISSTKAEMGDDESIMHVMSTSQWQTNISSQWNEKTGDDAGSDLEDGDIVTQNNPMAISILTSGNLKFEKSVDLNAVHMLDDSSDSADQVSTPPRSPEPYSNEDRAHASLSEDKSIDVLRASTPQPSDENSMSTLSSEISSETKTSSLSATIHEKEKLILDHELYLSSQEFSSLPKKVIYNLPGIDIEGYYTSSDGSQMKDNCSTQKSIEEICKENTKLTEENKEEKEKLCKIEDDKDISSIIKPAAQLLQNCSQIIEKESMESEVPQNFPDSTNHSNFNDAIHVSKQYTLQQSLLGNMHPDAASHTEQIHYHANFDSEIIPEKMIFTEPSFKSENNQQSNQSTNWMDCYKTENSIVQLKNVDPEFTYEGDAHFENAKQKEIEKLCDKDKDDIKPDSTTEELNPSDSMQKSSFVEDERQHNQIFVEHVPIETRTLVDKPTEQEQMEKKGEFVPINVDEVFKEKVASEDISSKEGEIKPRGTILPEDTTIEKSKEDITGIAEASVGIVAATVVAIANPTKAKTTTTTSAKTRPTKTMTTKAITTKTVTKSTPTSPSKTISAAMRATATSAAQSIAKKSATSTATRPKQLDGSAKIAISSTSGKTTITKATTKTAMITTATRTSASPRMSSTPRPKTTISSKEKSGTPIEKKSMTSGDAKSISKSATTKSTNAKTTSAKTTLVKTSSTTVKTVASSVTLKSRPASATSAAKNTSTSKQSTTGVNGASRPRTAPISSSTTKPRESTGRTIAAAKSPLIDKQSKETVNKQISRSGASASKTSGRASVPIGTGITKTRTPSGKLTQNATATSPTKKTLTSKTASRTLSTATKRLSSSEAKVLQNGISKEEVTKAVITAASKPEDDIPRKDPSPVNVPTDNQLIAD